MYLNSIFELTLVLDSEKFRKELSRAYDKMVSSGEDEYVDRSLAPKGITVTFRDSQYKKKVKLTINTAWVLDSDKPDPDKLSRKLEKRVDEYFGSKYGLNDFSLSGMILAANIDVGNHEMVSAYKKVLQRIGRVKGFSRPSDSWPDDDVSLYLEGNSNGISFLAYDLEGLLRGRLKESDTERKQIKDIAKKAEGLLRAEVRLTKPKAIQAYTNEASISKQIADLLNKSEYIFLDTFQRVVPIGDFHKKEKAVEIVRQKVKDMSLRRRMLRLLDLMPEKKSLLLAQKALNCRRIDDVMDMFGAIGLSPITISKRSDVKYLKSLYDFL